MFDGNKDKEERFKIRYSHEGKEIFKIFVDLETGVNYMFYGIGYGGGLTPLLDKEGNPVIESVK